MFKVDALVANPIALRVCGNCITFVLPCRTILEVARIQGGI